MRLENMSFKIKMTTASNKLNKEIAELNSLIQSLLDEKTNSSWIKSR